MAFSYQFQKQLEYRAAADPSRWWLYRSAIDQCDYARYQWQALYYARSPYQKWDQDGNGSDDIECVRNKLHELRTLLGTEAYYAGRMPSPVPLWAFTPIQ